MSKRITPSLSGKPPVIRSYRRVFSVENLSDEQLEAIKLSQMPQELSHLDDELQDWKPWLSL